MKEQKRHSESFKIIFPKIRLLTQRGDFLRKRLLLKHNAKLADFKVNFFKNIKNPPKQNLHSSSFSSYFGNCSPSDGNRENEDYSHTINQDFRLSPKIYTKNAKFIKTVRNSHVARPNISNKSLGIFRHF